MDAGAAPGPPLRLLDPTVLYPARSNVLHKRKPEVLPNKGVGGIDGIGLPVQTRSSYMAAWAGAFGCVVEQAP